MNSASILSDYDLFFLPEDYNLTVLSASKIVRPKSIYQHLMAMTYDEWNHLAESVFGCIGDELDANIVFDRIRETSKVVASSYLEIWIDKEGLFKAKVYI